MSRRELDLQSSDCSLALCIEFRKLLPFNLIIRRCSCVLLCTFSELSMLSMATDFQFDKSCVIVGLTSDLRVGELDQVKANSFDR